MSHNADVLLQRPVVAAGGAQTAGDAAPRRMRARPSTAARSLVFRESHLPRHETNIRSPPDEKAGGRGFEPRTLRTKTQRVSQPTPSPNGTFRPVCRTHGRTRRLRLAFRPVTSFSAVVMAAGQGTRMRSATPKVLHEICGRPMVAWPVIAAQEAGAERVVVVVLARTSTSPPRCPTARAPRRSRCPTAPAAPCSPRCPRSRPACRSSSSPATCRWSPRDAIQELVDAHVASGAAATMATTILDDATGYGRVVRDGRRPRRAGRRDQGRRRRDARGARRSARSTPGSTASTTPRSPTRSRASAPTTPRARSTCPTCSTLLRDDGA